MINTANRLTTRRRRLALVAAAVAVMPLLGVSPALVTAPQAAAALPDDLKMVTLGLFGGRNGDDHDGIACTGSRSCQPLSYPYFELSAGAEDLQNALTLATPGEPVVIFGYSQGARVVSQWLEDYQGTEGARTPDQLSILLIGNPDRRHGGAHVHLGQITPETVYDVIDVSREYDMASDWPDHPFNLLAVANAYAGMRYVHIDYDDIDIYDPGNYVWREGTTTYVFVPTQNIPLLEPLRRFGLDALADTLNDSLKAKIDRAYDRSYLPAAPGWPAELLPKTEPVQQDPTPTEPATLTAARTPRTSSPAVDEDTADPPAETAPADDPTADAAETDDLSDPVADDTDATAPTPPASGADDSGSDSAASDRPARKRLFGGRLLGRHAQPTASTDSPSAAS